MSAGRVALAALVFGLLVASCQYLTRDDAAPVDTVRVVRGDIEKTVTAVGSLKPKDYVDVGTQVSGRVEKLHVAIGDQVARGDLIAEIDPRIYESTVRKDEANLEHLRARLRQQTAQLELAYDQLARNERMLAANAVSHSVVDEARAAAKIAAATVAATRAEIKAAQATLEGNRANLGYTKIYSPMAGTVVSQATLEGQTVNAAQSAPVIVQVANLASMTVWAQVAEADVTRIRPGMSAYFTTLGAPEQRWTGTVRQVQPTPETENDVVLYNVLIDVANDGQVLLPEMTVQVFFVLGEAKDVPLVPLNALRPGTQGGSTTYTARVLTADGIETRLVQVGLTNRTLAQVRSGLSLGEQLIVASAVPPEAGARSTPRRPRFGPRL